LSISSTSFAKNNKKKTLKKKRLSLVDFKLIELLIDNNLSISLAIAIKLNESIFVFFFFFFLLHKSISLPSIKKDVRQLFDAIKNIKAIKLTKQQLKTIYTCYNDLEI